MSAPETVSPLAHCFRAGTFGAAGPNPLQISERRLAVQRIIARGDATDALAAAEKVAGLKLPPPGHAAAGNELTAIWVAPATWLVMQPAANAADFAARLARACGPAVSVVDQSGAYAALRLSGTHARDVLAKGCRIDLHSRSFGPGRAAVTLLAHVHAVVWQSDEAPTFELMVPSTLAEHVFEWLCHAAAPFGYEVSA